MKRTFATTGALVLIAAGFAAACSSSSSNASGSASTSAAPGTTAITKASFVEQANAICKQLDSDAATDKTIGAATLSVGAAALVTGVVLIAVGKPKPAAAAKARVEPWFGGTSAGLRGTF